MKKQTSIAIASVALGLTATLLSTYLPDSKPLQEPDTAAALASSDIPLESLAYSQPNVDSLDVIPLLDPRYKYSTD